MSFFSRLFGTANSEENKDISKNESAVSTLSTQALDNDSQIAAVIMAALMSILSEENTGELKIKSIRRTGRSSPVWNIAGRDQYIISKL